MIHEEMMKAWDEAHRDYKDVTHWLMTFDAYDRFRDESRNLLTMPADPAKQPECMGLPIYLTYSLEEPGVMLRDGEPPDEMREQELKRQLVAIQREYMEKSRPVVEELAKLEARKPPNPLVFVTHGGTIGDRIEEPKE